MFGVAILLILAVLSAFNMVNKIHYGVESGTAWNNTQKAYISANVTINEIMNNSAGVVMTNNPPGYTLATGRKSVMIPSGDVESVLSVCEQFEVKYVIVNDERQDFKLKINEDQSIATHFIHIFDDAGYQIYEYQP